MTTKRLDWLNQNRYRAYPFINDRGLLCDNIRIPDSVILDCLVVDTRHDIGIPELKFTKIEINQSNTVIYFTYGDISSSVSITGGALSGDGSIVKLSGILPSGFPSQLVHFSLILSSHAYLIDTVGKGTWTFNGVILPSKIVSVTASGVSGIKTNGSRFVQEAGTATGHVHLVDGYRTQPVISNGKVLVKVGTSYGYDPCHYPREIQPKVSCDDLMFFFCGQNAINSGNVILKGGPGVNVKQGQSYTAKVDILDTYGKVGIHAGESIPCIEVTAASELMRIYRPSSQGSSSFDSSDSSS